MKIVQVLMNYYPSIGGTQILFKNISEKCVSDYGDEVEVFTTNSYYGPEKKQFKSIEPEIENINGVKVYRFSFYRFHLFFIRKLAKIIAYITQQTPYGLLRFLHGPWSPSLKKAITNTDADIIVASSSHYLYILYSLWRNKINNPKPFVIQGAVHFYLNSAVPIFANKTLEAIKKCEYYISNTDYEKQRLIELGVDAEKIVTVGVGVEMKSFENGDRNYFRQQLNIKDDEILIAYVGRIESTKSIGVLIDAMQLVLKENNKIKLAIAGYANNYLDVLINKLNQFSNEQKQSIHFLTNISADRKNDLYYAMDILCLPSISESFGMVFLEAWSCKKPVIGTSIGAVKCVVNDGVDGLLAIPGNVKDLAEKILQLSSDTALQQTFGINGFNKTKELYTWEVITKKYHETYAKAIEKFKNGKN